MRSAPPGAVEFAVTPFVGAAAVALVNAVSVWVALGRPSRLGLRLQQHAFDALATWTVAAWLALVPVLLLAAAWWRERGVTDVRVAVGWRFRWLGWCSAGFAATLAMRWILGDHLQHQADVFLEGRFSKVVFVALLLGSGFGILAAQLIGATARAISPRAAWLVALPALAALIANHCVLRDDYFNVHAAITWAAMTLLGAAFARPVAARLSRRSGALGMFVALLGMVVPPANDVRLALFRELGAVAPWVLARVVWQLPSVPVLAAAPGWLALRSEPVQASGRPLVEAPVVVLITVDALRADVVADPANAARLPNLTRLRNAGIYVPRAVAPGSQTAVSLSAMFSGRPFSGQHWTMHGEGSARFQYPATEQGVRFPELLTKVGVRTEGFFALRFLAGAVGVTRGFATEHMLTEGRKHAPANVVLGPLLAGLDKLGPKEPAFFYAHLTEPHEPYDRGALKTGSNFERYVSEIEVVDAWLGRVSRRLEQRAKGRGYLVVSADHGEAFGEHGTVFHTKTLYDELVRVPLIVSGPRLRAVRCDSPASLVDVGPTILAIFGLPIPLNSLGQNLVPIGLGVRSCDAPRRPVFAEGRLRQAYFTSDGLKVIEDHVSKTVEVFDLVRDPGELDNLFGRQERASRAVAELRAFFRAESLTGYEPPYKP